ncbi:hypothetical protein Desku_1031 [Desulfofundulus kuznetsovii DSM 6115]|uniref:Uncharacterized protein n=1 Tax=Desulfofundulus kuznetsovii (strain DSM 6115 / VKM B-1805 / 17) TaxID=760568 RepID=A0AAU8PM56_DESK7|nr:hypothetical protein Desku_1031 [Desulfofundulus kuznetsovii DSM 6115]
MNEQLLRTLQDVDMFHKTCLLLFNDFTAYVRERLLGENTFAWQEANYIVWNHEKSQHVGNFVFEHKGKYKFAFLLIKVIEDKITRGPGYKEICSELGVDLRFPLLFITGIYRPRNVNDILKNLDLRRAWPHHLLKLELPDEILQKVSCSSPHRFEEELVFETDPSVGNWWCNGAQFKIRRVTNIKDQQTLARIADELLEY